MYEVVKLDLITGLNFLIMPLLRGAARAGHPLIVIVDFKERDITTKFTRWKTGAIIVPPKVFQSFTHW